MKKILLMASVAVAMGLFTACDSDRDDNPTLTIPETFRLNAPAIAENNTIDLANTETITITCDQPNYGGYPVVTEYTVEYSTSETFEEGATYTMPSTYTSTVINLSAKTINSTLIEAYQAEHGENTSPAADFPLYIRLAAKPANVDVTPVYSNTITLPSCRATFKAPDVTIPADLFVVGSNIGNAWNTWQRLAHPFGTSGVYYTVVWMPEGGGQFKFGTKEGDWTGHSAISEFNDNASVGISAASNDNIVFGKGGWFTLEFIAKIKGGALVYTLNVYDAHVFVTGNACGGFPPDTALECTAPADNTGEWVSPEFTASGELRAYIQVGDRDWWRTEFTLKGGSEIYFRETVDIPSSWEDALGADYSVAASAGKRLYVSFDSGTGSVK